MRRPRCHRDGRERKKERGQTKINLRTIYVRVYIQSGVARCNCKIREMCFLSWSRTGLSYRREIVVRSTLAFTSACISRNEYRAETRSWNFRDIDSLVTVPINYYSHAILILTHRDPLARNRESIPALINTVSLIPAVSGFRFYTPRKESLDTYQGGLSRSYESPR